MLRKTIYCLTVLLAACNNESNKTDNSVMKYETTGSIEVIDPSLDKIIDSTAKIEIIATGFEWSEGPLWIEKHNMLLFSDVPANTIYKWTEAKGSEIYLKPSGFSGTASQSKEPGSNGLVLDKQGSLVLCQHGNRQMARMDAPLDKPAPKFITIAGSYNDKKFSSPNDAVYNNAGELFLTDPPYDLPSQGDDDPSKEIKWNGVYKVKTNGEVILLVDSISRPNRIAFMPGENQLIVACSDPETPNWYIYDVNDDSLVNGKIFYSKINEREGLKGLPDGLKIDGNGNVFASGPGGLWIFNRRGKVIGKIKLDEAASNVALSADEKTLYITNDMRVLRVIMRK